MAKRRRSLLGGRGPALGGPASAEETDGSDVALDEPPATDFPGSDALASEPLAVEPLATEPLPPAPELPGADASDVLPEPEPPAPEPPVPEHVAAPVEPEPPAAVAPRPDLSAPEPSEPPWDAAGQQEPASEGDWPDPVRDAPSGPPAQPSFQALTGYSSIGGGDAPVAQDLFGEGGFDDFEGSGPPTEEHPAGVMEDVGQPYNTPYSVPEPPPIPGILDRFTPPPAQRTELGGRNRKPAYLADTPAAADRYEPTPAPPKKRAARPSAPGDDDDDDVEVAAPRSGAPVGLAVLIVGLGFGALGIGALVLGIAMLLGRGGGDGTDPDGLDREVTPGGVEVRDNMLKKPGLIGIDPTVAPMPDVAPVPVPSEPAAATDAPLVPAPAPDPAPQPGKAPTPTPAPGPKPAPKPVPVTPAPQAAKATLKIRSNRRVLVYVNGQAIGYTPQDHRVDPGTFAISAMVPGQPNTKQTRDAAVSAVGTTVPVDFTF